MFPANLPPDATGADFLRAFVRQQVVHHRDVHWCWLGGFLARPRRFGVRRMRRAISDSARLAFARRVDSDALATRAATAPNSPHDTTEWCSAARGA